MSPELRWFLFSLLVFMGGWAILGNWVIALRRGGSLVPVVGGVMVAVAFAVVPWDLLQSLWWAPLMVDLGCGPMLLLAGSFLTWQWLSRRQQ
jgi:hypothetical protein